ncbi:MAG: dethiobiotin synthase [Xanthomonadales bacterium]|jgi:dethiobiotin synthetase|nr:dethiobiotin synthase [Xanthomonadales bacterium]
MNTWFVTGTDTEIGKTFATCDLLKHLVASGQRAAGLKPIASGCESSREGLRNEDARLLMAASNVRLDYAQVNPYAFEPPIAPHIAAERAGVVIDTAFAARALPAVQADWVLVEGAGGWNIPLGQGRVLKDLAAAFTSQVLLVVGMRLGCINHALLSAQQIRRDGFELVGWVANEVDPAMLESAANLATLDDLMPAPRLAFLPWTPAAGEAVIGDWRLP